MDSEQLRLQELHITRLKKHGHHIEISFGSQDELIKLLYKSSLFDIIFPLSETKPYNLPYASIGDLFKGRDEEMNKLFEGLTSAQTNSTAIISNAIHGLGGIGKTRLAVEYALRHQKDYTALLFVTADTPEKLSSSIASL